MEINRRAAANRGNEAARSRAKVKERSSRDRGQGRAFTFKCRNGRRQKVQVINFMFTVTTAAVAATNLSEYVGFEE